MLVECKTKDVMRKTVELWFSSHTEYQEMFDEAVEIIKYDNDPKAAKIKINEAVLGGVIDSFVGELVDVQCLGCRDQHTYNRAYGIELTFELDVTEGK